MDTPDAVKHGLGIASLGVGAVGIVKPEFPARLTGAAIAEARGLGFRDLAVGITIYAHPRVGLAQRAIVDIGDAVTFAKRKPAVAAVAVGSAALAVYALTRA